MFGFGMGMGAFMGMMTPLAMVFMGQADLIGAIILPTSTWFFMIGAFFLIICLDLLYNENSWILQQVIALAKKRWSASRPV